MFFRAASESEDMTQQKLTDILFLISFLCISVVLSYKSLIDVDIGWHLAGGLWMLDACRVPTTDMLQAQGSFWLAYSWTFEILIALVFKYFSFYGLQVLQTVICLLSVVYFISFVRSLARNGSQEGLKRNLQELLALVIIFLFTSAVWHLRPQLVSVLLFAFLLERAEGGRLSFLLVAMVTILWANIHVYWIFAPVIFGAYKVLGERRFVLGTLQSLVLLSLGVCTPYGLSIYPAFYKMMFHHQQAYRIISEFQPLSLQHGYLFVAWGSILGACILFLLKKRFFKPLPLHVLFLLFAYMGFTQIKYLPLFAIVAAAVLCRLRFEEYAFEENPFSIKDVIAIVSALTLLCGVCFFFIEPAPPLSEKYEELQGIVKELPHVEGRSPVPILNHFDDGGFLSLFLMLQGKEMPHISNFRTTIDGRTLVMGEERLSEFASIKNMDEQWCAVVGKWNSKLAVLPVDMDLAQALIQGECGGEWQVVARSKHWLVLLAPHYA